MQVSLSLLASAAFNGAPATRPAMRSHSIAMVERSAAIPFLKKPSVLDGTLAGDVGFDPMGISTSICEINPQGLNYVGSSPPPSPLAPPLARHPPPPAPAVARGGAHARAPGDARDGRLRVPVAGRQAAGGMGC